MEIFKQIFTWWNSQTGTRIYTWRKGNYVGSDNMEINIMSQKTVGDAGLFISKKRRRLLFRLNGMDGHQTFNEIPKYIKYRETLGRNPTKVNEQGPTTHIIR